MSNYLLLTTALVLLLGLGAFALFMTFPGLQVMAREQLVRRFGKKDSKVGNYLREQRFSLKVKNFAEMLANSAKEETKLEIEKTRIAKLDAIEKARIAKLHASQKKKHDAEFSTDPFALLKIRTEESIESGEFIPAQVRNRLSSGSLPISAEFKVAEFEDWFPCSSLIKHNSLDIACTVVRFEQFEIAVSNMMSRIENQISTIKSILAFVGMIIGLATFIFILPTILN